MADISVSILANLIGNLNVILWKYIGQVCLIYGGHFVQPLVHWMCFRGSHVSVKLLRKLVPRRNILSLNTMRDASNDFYIPCAS